MPAPQSRRFSTFSKTDEKSSRSPHGQDTRDDDRFGPDGRFYRLRSVSVTSPTVNETSSRKTFRAVGKAVGHDVGYDVIAKLFLIEAAAHPRLTYPGDRDPPSRETPLRPITGDPKFKERCSARFDRTSSRRCDQRAFRTSGLGANHFCSPGTARREFHAVVLRILRAWSEPPSPFVGIRPRRARVWKKTRLESKTRRADDDGGLSLCRK